mmetsp:Transcript_38518/g.78996  ORF Transcript_38518/g.78996 Transcript_38518/m.78996 type:complete len:375 (+) Transcript_38518:223-1347(+)
MPQNFRKETRKQLRFDLLDKTRKTSDKIRRFALDNFMTKLMRQFFCSTSTRLPCLEMMEMIWVWPCSGWNSRTRWWRNSTKKLVSPCIRPAYKALKLKAKKVHVVLYTRRPQLVQYRSGFRDCALQVQYKDEWHCNGQICFPSHIRESSEITDCYKGPETIPEEATDMQKAIERLLAARDAITEELELDAPPDVVVTATEKDVSSTVCALGLPDRNAYLFDDNTNLQYDSKVVITEPLESLPLEQTREVLKFMNHHLPVHTLDEDLVEFLQGSPLDNRALEFDPETQQLCWRCPVMTQQPPVWRIPEFVATEAMGRPRSGGLSRSRSLSPVTPDSVTPPLESLASSARSCASQQGAVNLRAAVERAIELRKAAA